jgi:hypothetical protein
MVGVPVTATIENDYSAFADAYMKGSLVRPDSRVGRQMASLAGKIMGTEEKPAEEPAARSRWRAFLSFD